MWRTGSHDQFTSSEKCEKWRHFTPPPRFDGIMQLIKHISGTECIVTMEIAAPKCKHVWYLHAPQSGLSRDFPRITADALHTTQWKHTQFTIVHCSEIKISEISPLFCKKLFMEAQLMWLPLSPENTFLEQSAWNSFVCCGCRPEKCTLLKSLFYSLLLFLISVVSSVAVICWEWNGGALMPNWTTLLCYLSGECVFSAREHLFFFFLLLTVLPSHPLPHCTGNLHYSGLHMNSMISLSLSILHMLSLTNTSQNILNWFCFRSIFFLALLFEPQRDLSSRSKKQLSRKCAPSPPLLPVLTPSTSHLLFSSQKTESFCV